MYLVACKWTANGEVGYQKPMDYLSLPNATEAQMEYAVAVIVMTPELEKLNCVFHYAMLEDANSLDKISLTYYTDKDSFDAWNTSTAHTTFLEARTKFLTTTGIQLSVAEKETLELTDSVDYATANQLFS
jgi:hypothetical protein